MAAVLAITRSYRKFIISSVVAFSAPTLRSHFDTLYFGARAVHFLLLLVRLCHDACSRCCFLLLLWAAVLAQHRCLATRTHNDWSDRPTAPPDWFASPSFAHTSSAVLSLSAGRCGPPGAGALLQPRTAHYF